MTTYNRVTTSIEAVRGGYRVRIRYWSDEHNEFREEISARHWNSAAAAEQAAVSVAHEIQSKLL